MKNNILIPICMVFAVAAVAVPTTSESFADIMIKNSIEIHSPSVGEHDLFGSSVAPIGDINGDGIPDIAVGAPGHQDKTIGIGDIYLMMLDVDGAILDGGIIEIALGTPNGPESLGPYSLFGTSVANIGDMDGNGISDIAVGAPGHPTHTQSTGTVYIILLGNGGTVLKTMEINSETPNGPESLQAGDLFGTSVANIGDMDGNGTADIAVGAPGHHVGGIASGDVYVLLLNNDGSIIRTVEINADTPKGPFLEISNRFGASVAAAGDVDGNGTPDMVVGAPGYHDRGNTTGDVYVILFNENVAILNTIDINSETPNGPNSLVKGDLFGESVASLGDIDGNGTPDIIVGAPGHHTQSVGTGDLYVLYLESNGAIKNTFEINADTTNGPNLGGVDLFGSSVAIVGDINMDGIPDLAAGAPGPEVSEDSPGTDVLHLMMLNGTILSGTIFSDVNNNGNMDAGELGIANHKIITFNFSTGTFTELITTPDGKYTQFFEMPPGLILVQSSYYPPSTILSSEKWYTYETLDDYAVSEFNIGFYPVPADELITLDITTFYDNNRNGIMDAGEAPFPEIEVTAYTYTIGPLSSIFTNANGMATRADLVPADFLAQVVLPEGYEATSPIHTYSNGVEVPGALIISGTSFDSAYTMMIGLAPTLPASDRGTNVDMITFIEYNDETTALSEVQDGSFDMYYYPIPREQTEDGLPEGVQGFESIGGVTYDLFLNPANVDDQFNPFAFQEMRYAINFLVDREEIVREHFRGHGNTMISVFGPTHNDYLLVYKDIENLGIRYDVNVADMMISDVLEENGATKSDGKWLMDDTQITVKMFIRNDDSIRDAIGNSLAEELVSLGFAVDIINGNLGDAFSVVYGSNPANLDWHIYTGAFGGPTVTKYDNTSIATYYAPWGSFMPGLNNPNYWNYENEFLDETTMRIYNEEYSNDGERANLVREAVLAGVQESVRIFLGYENDQYVAVEGIGGVVNAQGQGITNRATLINANAGDDDLVVGVKYIRQSPWNTVSGFTDTYSTYTWNILRDPAAVRDPFTGDLTPVRVAWSVDTNGPDGMITLHDDAVMWDAASQEWEILPQGTESISKVRVDLKFSKWHNGIPMDINDVMYPTYLYREWITKSSSNPDDVAKYDPELAAGANPLIKGIRIVDDDTIDVYVDYWHFDESEIAARTLLWSSIPWEMHAAMEAVVLNGDAAFSNSVAVSNDISWISMLDDMDVALIKNALEVMSDGMIPAGVYDDTVNADSRYTASINWITEKGTAVISNGPFYLDEYIPEMRLVVRAFDDSSYPLSPGHWNYLAAERTSLEGEISIGALAPLTGGAAKYGEEINAVSSLAVNDFNDYLESLDARWSLSVDRRDSQTNPAVALEELSALNNSNIKIIDGNAIDYDSTLLRYANENDMLLLSCCSVTTPFAINNDAMFRLAPGHAQHAEKLADVMNGDQISMVVPVGLENIWVNDLLELTGTSFEGMADGNMMGDVISYTDDLEGPAATLADIVQQMIDNDAGNVAVLYVGFERNVDFLVEASKHDVLNSVKWYSADVNTAYPNIIDNETALEFAERVGLVSVQPRVHDNVITQQIAKYFEDNVQFYRAPSVYTSFEYDVIWLLGLSILDAQSTDVNDVKASLYDVSEKYVGASGNTVLNSAGDRADGQYAVWRIIDGAWAEIVEIGGLIPVTRADGAGVHRNVAAEYAVNDFNEYLSEKSATWRLGIQVADTASEGYVEPVRSFNDDGIRYITGPSASGGIAQIKDYLNANNMLLLSCCSTAPSIANEGDNVFRLAPDDSLQGVVVAQLLTDDKISVLVPVWRDDAFGNGLRNSTATSFESMGGMVDDFESYPLCDESGCYDSMFEEMTATLADKIEMLVNEHGSEKIAVMYVGIGETEVFMEKAAAHEILHSVQWIGSDANVQSEVLVNNEIVLEFLKNTKFRERIFDVDDTSPMYTELNTRFSEDQRIEGNPNVYVYASYDSVQILGLAIEATGDAGFEDVKRQIPMITSQYSGAIGNISLNAAGDAAEASYAIWTVGESGWERYGTYVPGTGFVPASVP